MAAVIAGFNTLSKEGVDYTQTYTGYNQAAAQSSTNDPSYPGLPFTLGELSKGVDESEWVFCLAGTALAIGDVVMIDNTAALWTASAITNTVASAKLGDYVAVCPLVAIASGAYGWLQRAGKCAAITVVTSTSANVGLKTTSTAGRLISTITTGTTVNISGIIITTAKATTTGTTPGLLNYPVVGAND